MQHPVLDDHDGLFPLTQKCYQHFLNRADADERALLTENTVRFDLFCPIDRPSMIDVSLAKTSEQPEGEYFTGESSHSLRPLPEKSVSFFSTLSRPERGALARALVDREKRNAQVLSEEPTSRFRIGLPGGGDTVRSTEELEREGEALKAELHDLVQEYRRLRDVADHARELHRNEIHEAVLRVLGEDSSEDDDSLIRRTRIHMLRIHRALADNMWEFGAAQDRESEPVRQAMIAQQGSELLTKLHDFHTRLAEEPITPDLFYMGSDSQLSQLLVPSSHPVTGIMRVVQEQARELTQCPREETLLRRVLEPPLPQMEVTPTMNVSLGRETLAVDLFVLQDFKRLLTCTEERSSVYLHSLRHRGEIHALMNGLPRQSQEVLASYLAGLSLEQVMKQNEGYLSLPDATRLYPKLLRRIREGELDTAEAS